MLKPSYKFTPGSYTAHPGEMDYLDGCRMEARVEDSEGITIAHCDNNNAELFAASPRLLELLEDMFKPVPMGSNPKRIFFERRRNAEAFLNELKPKLQGEQK